MKLNEPFVSRRSRFENTGIEHPAALRYRVRAYSTGGYQAYPNVAPGAPAIPGHCAPERHGCFHSLHDDGKIA